MSPSQRLTRLSTLGLALIATLMMGSPRPALAQAAPNSDAQVGAKAKSASKPIQGKKHRRAAVGRPGGVNPCMTPDPGFGVYDPWQRGLTVGQMIAPHKGGVTKSGGFDLIVHFHGHEAVRKEFVKAGSGVVLVGVDLGIGSGAYSSAFASPAAFERLIDSVEAQMSKRIGKKAHVRKLGLSAWSAGYGAIEMILRQKAGKNVDSVILLDSLHAGYADGSTTALKVAQIQPFVDFAKKAAQKQRLMFLSHSSIIPPGYASTTEVAHFVVKELRGKPKDAGRQDALGLDMFERFDKGNFYMRGYDGNDKPDHCAHLGLMADIMKVRIAPRWKTPRGRR